MNVCLLLPPRVLKLLSATSKPSPPLGLAYIAGALQSAGHNVTVIDAIGENPEQVNPFMADNIVTNGISAQEILERIPKNTQLLGVSIMFTANWLSDKKLIDFIGEKMPQLTIVAGGEHISAIPEVCMQQAKHLAICVLGEGEETIVELARAIENGQALHTVEGIAFKKQNEIITTARRNRTRELETIPRPAWELFPVKAYHDYSMSWGVDRGKSLPIIATRGCPYTCTFCSSPEMWGTKYSMRQPKDVVDEISHLRNKFGATNFDFYDLTAIIKKQWIIDFAKEVVSRDLNITWQIPGGTRSEAIDMEVAEWLYKSGCRNITYAPESGSQEILRLIKKKVVLSRMITSMQHSHTQKMNVKINIMIGFPEENHKHIWETLGFLIQASWAGVSDMFPATFIPYPGSELFKRLRAEGKINLNDDNYYLRFTYGDTFLKPYFYNEKINKYVLRVYLALYIVVFYSTNFIFRPSRIYRLIKNLLTGNFESRAEMAIEEIFRRKSYRPMLSPTPSA